MPEIVASNALIGRMPLRWQLLTNHASSTQHICVACKEKRHEPQKHEKPENPDISWDRATNVCYHATHLDDALKLEHLVSSVGQQQHQSHYDQQPTRKELAKRMKHQELCRLYRHSTRESVVAKGRRRESSHALNLQQDFQKLTKATINGKQQNKSIDKKKAKLRQSTTHDTVSGFRGPDILEMKRPLPMPFPSLETTVSSPTCLAQNASNRWQHPQGTHMDLHHDMEVESNEDHQRRRSTSYAHMLLRMRRHYRAVQTNGSHELSATVPPRRIRPERRVDHSSSLPNMATAKESTDGAIDLSYLRAYKDLR
ncbi:uncharacterized protein CCR75_001500 [Bremia lactucae]|uniref:Uncharacterized protein n=1 Tax=Bremia lactucae TaxID=4779 RepID=A0A976FG42_BRELC|nr:hypothetical protein CCR75_001500 [Bremia lactucae]